MCLCEFALVSVLLLFCSCVTNSSGNAHSSNKPKKEPPPPSPRLENFCRVKQPRVSSFFSLVSIITFHFNSIRHVFLYSSNSVKWVRSLHIKLHIGMAFVICFFFSRCFKCLGVCIFVAVSFFSCLFHLTWFAWTCHFFMLVIFSLLHLSLSPHSQHRWGLLAWGFFLFSCWENETKRKTTWHIWRCKQPTKTAPRG